LGAAVGIAPTKRTEHYLPLLYTLGAKLPNETPQYFNDQCVMGSLAMTSFVIS
jgi:4,5-DOPA dioxygenase extradiol